MKRYKYPAMFLCTLLFLQLFSYIFYKFGLSQTNSQLFFGYFSGNYLAIILAIVLMILLYCIMPKQKIVFFAFFLLAAAAISNTIDRLIYGGVVDYIKIWFIPLFNFADIVIVGSIIFIFYKIIKKSHS